MEESPPATPESTPASDGSKHLLRKLPSVDRLLAHPALAPVVEIVPLALVTDAARQALEEARDAVLRGEAATVPALDALAARAASLALESVTPSLRPVINATGVVIHTNLGRAPLSRSAREAIVRASAYSNLEYDLEAGARGSRYSHATAILRRLTCCEAAIVVNNNAAALVLALGALAAGKEVIVSRGQLVEIGGGFRIPEIMKQSGARLVEVGTTNRTYIRDYSAAISADTALLLRVHTSNFRITGFTTSPGIAELAQLAHERGLLVLDDLGSGALLDTSKCGLAREPMVQESLAAGADLVLFSGDKLLGGPQCGVILGRGPVVEALRRHPLARALRVDKLTLAALEATLIHYLKGEAEREVPVWQMISASEDALRGKAEAWAQRLYSAGVAAVAVRGESAVGGGSLPGETLPTWLVSIAPSEDEASASGRLARRLREAKTPVIARVERGSLLLDPRTVLPDEEQALLQSVQEVLLGSTPSSHVP